jgi:hypothetical protein
MMAIATQITLTERVIEVTADYLGPAARRFVQRQVKVHLNKPMDALEPADIAPLADWSKLALALLTSDKATVDKFQKELLELSKQQPEADKKD